MTPSAGSNRKRSEPTITSGKEMEEHVMKHPAIAALALAFSLAVAVPAGARDTLQPGPGAEDLHAWLVEMGRLPAEARGLHGLADTLARRGKFRFENPGCLAPGHVHAGCLAHYTLDAPGATTVEEGGQTFEARRAARLWGEQGREFRRGWIEFRFALAPAAGSTMPAGKRTVRTWRLSHDLDGGLDSAVLETFFPATGKRTEQALSLSANLRAMAAREMKFWAAAARNR